MIVIRAPALPSVLAWSAVARMAEPEHGWPDAKSATRIGTGSIPVANPTPDLLWLRQKADSRVSSQVPATGRIVSSLRSAGVFGTTQKISKIEKNLLFGTTRNRQVIAETTKSSSLTALELALRATPHRREPRGAYSRRPCGSMDFVGRTTAEYLNPGDRIPRQVRGPGHSATTPDQEGRAEADSGWGNGQVA